MDGSPVDNIRIDGLAQRWNMLKYGPHYHWSLGWTLYDLRGGEFLRILMVNKYYHPRIGGVETLVKTISEKSVARGHDVTVVALDEDRSADEKINGVRVVRFKRGFWGRTGFHPRVQDFLINANVSKNYDLVHIHGYHTLLALQAAGYCHAQKVPYVFTTHYHGKGHTSFRDILFRSYALLGKYIYRWSESIVCVSEYERSLVKHDFDEPEGKYRLIPNGGKEYPQIDVPKMRDTLLYVGRLYDYKGVDHILQAMAIMKGEGRKVNLRVIGDGPDRPRLETMIAALDLREQVTWVGRVSEEQLNKEYRSAAVLMLLSSAEAYGLVVAEALTCGTPCIVAKSAALTEFTAEPGCFGVDAPVDDRQLVSQLRYVLDNFGTIKVGPFSNKMISWDQVASEYLDCYRSVLEK